MGTINNKKITKLLQQGLEYHKSTKKHHAQNIYKKIIKLDPKNYNAHHLLGLLYKENMQFNLAIKSITTALQLAPEEPAFYDSLGNIYLKTDNYNKALINFKKSLELNPKNTQVLNNLAIVYANLGDNNAAKLYFEKITTLEPTFAQAYNNLGNISLEENNLTAAKNYYVITLQKDPDLLIAKANLAHTLCSQAEYNKAIILYKELQTQLNNQQNKTPFNSFNKWLNSKILIGLAMCYVNICEWEQLAALQENIKNHINNNISTSSPSIIEPFEAIALELTQELYLKICRKYFAKYQNIVKHNNIPLPQAIKSKPEVINIGYVSPDFSDGPIGLLVKGIFNYHDKNKFKIYGVYIGPKQNKPEQFRIAEFDNFIDLSEKSDLEAINIIRDHNLHILTDLAGYTKGSRPGIFAAKSAPIQCSWLGYSNSMGVPEYDYYITTKNIANNHLQKSFTEKLLFLPKTLISCCQFENYKNKPNSYKKDFSLPENKFIYCCFSKHYRITKEVFSAWVKILEKVPNSVLWLQADNNNSDFKKSICNKFSFNNIDPNRIIFAQPERLSTKWHHELADLWLDTFSLSSGTASILCAQIGLPVLTVAGNTSQARIASSFMQAIELNEVIAIDQQDYINKAVFFGQNIDELNQIKNKLRKNISKSCLFSPQNWIQNLENIYMNMLDFAAS